MPTTMVQVMTMNQMVAERGHKNWNTEDLDLGFFRRMLMAFCLNGLVKSTTSSRSDVMEIAPKHIEAF